MVVTSDSSIDKHMPGVLLLQIIVRFRRKRRTRLLWIRVKFITIFKSDLQIFCNEKEREREEEFKSRLSGKFVH